MVLALQSCIHALVSLNTSRCRFAASTISVARTVLRLTGKGKEEQTCCKLRLFMSLRGLLPTLFNRPRPDPLRFRIRGLGPRVGTPP